MIRLRFRSGVRAGVAEFDQAGLAIPLCVVWHHVSDRLICGAHREKTPDAPLFDQGCLLLGRSPLGVGLVAGIPLRLSIEESSHLHIVQPP
jgi:hypothetical protein